MKAARFDYVRATSCEQVTMLLSQGGGTAKIVAGCQSLGPMLNLRLTQPELLVDITGIAQLSRVEDVGDAITFGACTTHSVIEDGRVADPTRGLMAFVARGIAYRAVRNRGTLGGSLAHADPAADWISLMALLDAQYVVLGPTGARRVGCDAWMQGAFTTALADDEILVGVRIPTLSSSARWSYEKCNRKPGEFAQAIVAFVDDPGRDVCRAVIGATDGAPRIVTDARSLLGAWNAGRADAELAAAGLTPDSFEYRIHAATLKRAARNITGPTGCRRAA